MLEKKLVCLEMDDASGKDKRIGIANLNDWTYYRDFLNEINAQVTIAIEPQKADPATMKFLAENPQRFLSTVHGTAKYGHYGGIKTESQLKEMWEYTVGLIRGFGFDMGNNGNEIFIPPMHMISDNAIDVLHSYGIVVIGSDTNNFPLGSRDVRNGKGELVYNLGQQIQAYTPYRGVVFYKRYRPWMMRARYSLQRDLMNGIQEIENTSQRAKLIAGSYETYLDICERDFREKCLGGDTTFYAHELNIGGDRPFLKLLYEFKKRGLFDNVRFVNAKELSQHVINKE